MVLLWSCGCRHLPELLFSSACFSLSLQLSRNFLDGSEVALLLLRKCIYFSDVIWLWKLWNNLYLEKQPLYALYQQSKYFHLATDCDYTFIWYNLHYFIYYHSGICLITRWAETKNTKNLDTSLTKDYRSQVIPCVSSTTTVQSGQWVVLLLPRGVIFFRVVLSQVTFRVKESLSLLAPEKQWHNNSRLTIPKIGKTDKKTILTPKKWHKVLL